MKSLNNEWDRKLREKLETHDHSTSVKWRQIETRLSSLDHRRANKYKWSRIAAIFIGLMAVLAVFSWYTESSWENAPVASVKNLDASGPQFFSATELHRIYMGRD